MHYPHQGFLAVIFIKTVPAVGYQTDGFMFPEQFSWKIITRGLNAKGFEKNLVVANLYKLSSALLARLSQDCDVIVAVLFQD